MRVSGGDGENGLVFSVVSISPHCIHNIILSIDISVQNHIVTRTMSLASKSRSFPDAFPINAMP